VEDEHFSQEGDFFYRNGKVYRDIIDRTTGNCVERQLIRTNHARVMYELPSSDNNAG
jgi:vancomycin resistance protein VanW